MRGFSLWYGCGFLEGPNGVQFIFISLVYSRLQHSKEHNTHNSKRSRQQLSQQWNSNTKCISTTDQIFMIMNALACLQMFFF